MAHRKGKNKLNRFAKDEEISSRKKCKFCSKQILDLSEDGMHISCARKQRAIEADLNKYTRAVVPE